VKRRNIVKVRKYVLSEIRELIFVSTNMTRPAGKQFNGVYKGTKIITFKNMDTVNTSKNIGARIGKVDENKYNWSEVNNSSG
jgi:hypothetical protein